MLTYFLFVLGFVFIIKGADILVDGASSVAKRFNVSDMVVGLTVVSFGTSLPELIVNLIASFNGESELALGNVFGSNIANVLLILGITALICPLPLKRNTILSEIPFAILAALLIGFLANVSMPGTQDTQDISRLEGLILLFFFALFMVYIIKISKEDIDYQEEEPIPVMSTSKASFFIIAGCAGLFFGGKWVVDGAVGIAHEIGMSESFVGLTVVAIGTSLPELVTSAVAAYKRNIDIAVGNVVGSNIFNILWILGISATINPLPFNLISNFDIFMMIISSTMLIVVIAAGNTDRINRISGILFLLAYAAYIYALIMRG